MKMGAVTSLALGAFAFLAALVVLTEKPEDIEGMISDTREQFTVYDNKKMYPEASASLLDIYELDKTDYSVLEEYVDYIADHSLVYSSEFVSLCRSAVNNDTSAYLPAKLYLGYLIASDDESIYSFAKQEMNRFEGEERQYFSDYYDSIKCEYDECAGDLQSVSPWYNDYIMYTGEDGGQYLIGGGSEYSFAVGELGQPVVVSKLGGISYSSKKYDRIFSYSQPIAYVSVEDDGDMVYVNMANNRTIVPYDAETGTIVEYDYLGAYYGNAANCCVDGVWGYVDKTPNLRYTGYKYASPFANGVAAVQYENGKWGFIKYSSDLSFTKLTEAVYDEIYIDSYGYPLSYGYGYVKQGSDKWQLIKVTLNEDKNDVIGMENVGEQKLDEVKPFGINGAACVGGKWGLLDAGGSWSVEPQYEDAYSLVSGLAPVKLDGKWGFINGKGKMLLEPQFEDTIGFNQNGVAAVKQSGWWEYIRLLEYIQ